MLCQIGRRIVPLPVILSPSALSPSLAGAGLNFGSAPSKEGNNEQNKEHHEKNLGDPRCGACDTSKAKNGGDNRDDQKYNGVV